MKTLSVYVVANAHVHALGEASVPEASAQAQRNFRVNAMRESQHADENNIGNYHIQIIKAGI